jgi:hypothetical protein
MAVNMAKLENENKNLSICYWPIDDSYEVTVLRMLTTLTGIPKKVVAGIDPFRDQSQRRLLEEGKDLLHHLMSTGRIIVKDLSDIDTTRLANRWVQETQQQFSNDVILVVDALNDVPEKGEEYEKTNRLIEWMQNMTSNIGSCMMCTAHTNKRQKIGDKGSGEPHQSNIKGNNKIEFAAKILGAVYNEYQDRGADVTEHGWEKRGRIMPAVKLNLVKVKSFLGEKGTCWYKMDEDSITLKPTTEAEITLADRNTVNTSGIQPTEPSLNDLNNSFSTVPSRPEDTTVRTRRNVL